MGRPNSDIGDDFLKTVFDQILLISRGDCDIKDEDLISLENDEQKRNIFAGLKLLHEDLELYKKEYKQKLDADYQLKVLQKKNAELEQFNYMASHDLKEPLRSIISFSSLLKKDFQNISSETIQTYLAFISDSGMRMHQLIDGLLQFSIAGSNINKTKVNLDRLVKTLLEDLQALRKDRDIEFNIDRLPYIQADQTSIKLIFQNLISNAIKFSSHENKLTISIEVKSDDDFHFFSVSDNGPGIEEEYQEKVFELLTRLQPKSEIEGAGIGLSTCKKLVGMHGGEIWIDADYEEGTKFIFTIPRFFVAQKRIVENEQNDLVSTNS